jgi:hypothetical protein
MAVIEGLVPVERRDAVGLIENDSLRKLAFLDQLEPAVTKVVARRKAPIERRAPCVQISALATAGGMLEF